MTELFVCRWYCLVSVFECKGFSSQLYLRIYFRLIFIAMCERMCFSHTFLSYRFMEKAMSSDFFLSTQNR